MDRGNSFAMGASTHNGPLAPYRDEGWDYRPVTFYDWTIGRDYR